jgi:hypothetical protein
MMMSCSNTRADMQQRRGIEHYTEQTESYGFFLLPQAFPLDSPLFFSKLVLLPVILVIPALLSELFYQVTKNW